ncbi:MAG: hypothetical protein DMG57_32350 [Acidobacteria bacterium]|nr:MAG: hypothetical protein DMG57_32350 [Acidobacteriota bacterium]
MVHWPTKIPRNNSEGKRFQLNNREFRKHLQAIAQGDKPEEKSKPPVQEPPVERKRPAQKEPPAKKPPAKSKQSTQKLRQVRRAV